MANHSDDIGITTNQRWINSIRLMRIPFSVFLMPVYWFALLHIDPDATKAILVFITLHLLAYPASNGYNSYFDRDETSIGGLKHPPKVTKELWYLVIAFDIAAIALAFAVNLKFAIMVFVYLMVSKAYSYDRIRLKKYPIIGAATVVLFQGLFTYMMVQVGASKSFAWSINNFLFGIVSTLFLLGSYPMTQIYQHDEDEKHGDTTLSMLLGLKGTFIFTTLVFLIASVMLVVLFYVEGNLRNAIIYLIAGIPVNIFFLKWFGEYMKGKAVVTFDRTMTLNAMSSLLLSAAFIVMLILKSIHW